MIVNVRVHGKRVDFVRAADVNGIKLGIGVMYGGKPTILETKNVPIPESWTTEVKIKRGTPLPPMVRGPVLSVVDGDKEETITVRVNSEATEETTPGRSVDQFYITPILPMGRYWKFASSPEKFIGIMGAGDSAIVNTDFRISTSSFPVTVSGDTGSKLITYGAVALVGGIALYYLLKK